MHNMKCLPTHTYILIRRSAKSKIMSPTNTISQWVCSAAVNSSCFLTRTFQLIRFSLIHNHKDYGCLCRICRYRTTLNKGFYIIMRKTLGMKWKYSNMRETNFILYLLNSQCNQFLVCMRYSQTMFKLTVGHIHAHNTLH